MALFNSLRRASLGQQIFICSDCFKHEVNADRVSTGLVLQQSGFVMQNYTVGKTTATIVFALCRTCCDRFTLTKVRWKIAELQWQISQICFFIKTYLVSLWKDNVK